MDSMKKSGFSLIELLVVIVIIGILFAVFVPAYGEFYKRARVENSAKILETGLTEAFSLARAQSSSFMLTLNQGGSSIGLDCMPRDPADTTTDCFNNLAVTGRLGAGLEGLELERGVEIREIISSSGTPLSVVGLLFKAPHGDLEFYDAPAPPASEGTIITTQETIEVTLASPDISLPVSPDEASLVKTLKIYRDSGLVERQ